MKRIIILTILLTVAGFPAEPYQNKELDQFYKVKASVYDQEWAKVRVGMEEYLRTFPAGKMRDEALYWLGRSFDRLARQEKERTSIVSLKTKAAETLARMIREFPGSLWSDDARELRLSIAGELAILGVASERAVIEEAVRSQNKNEVELRRIALKSLVRLDARTVLPAMDDFLKTEGDPGLRKEGVALLGQRFTRPVVGLLESVAKKDANEDVRREAEYWLAKIRTRLIPVQLNYYCYEARLTGRAAFDKVPEGKVASFAPPHGRTGSESRTKNEIGRIFGGRIDFTGSMATSMGAANLYEIMKTEGTTIRTAHKINNFRLGLDGGSLVKTPTSISGQVFFDGQAADFSVNNQNDTLLAARRGERLALMYLEMAPKETESLEDLETEDSPSGLGSFFESFGKLFKSKSKEPVYYQESRYPSTGLVIHSTMHSTPEITKLDVIDYSLAKAEIPGSGGTWILTGHLLLPKKENVLIGRMAKLVKPDGTVAAEADEIHVPIKDPAAFSTGGGRKPAPDSIYPVAMNLEGGGMIHSSRTQFRLAEWTANSVDFQNSKALLPGPGGTWTLTGRLVLEKEAKRLQAREATLINPQGKIVALAAFGEILVVPVTNPEKYAIEKDRR